MRSPRARRSRAIFAYDDRERPRFFPGLRRLNRAEYAYQYHCRQNAEHIARAPAHSATPQSVALQIATFCLQGHYIRFSVARNVIRAVIGLFVRPSGQPSRTPALKRAWIATTQGESVKWRSPDATGGLWDPASVTELDPLQSSCRCATPMLLFGPHVWCESGGG